MLLYCFLPVPLAVVEGRISTSCMCVCGGALINTSKSACVSARTIHVVEDVEIEKQKRFLRSMRSEGSSPKRTKSG